MWKLAKLWESRWVVVHYVRIERRQDERLVDVALRQAAERFHRTQQNEAIAGLESARHSGQQYGRNGTLSRILQCHLSFQRFQAISISK